ncbi:hypothetical protein [Tropicimonas sp. IMCC6043]|uniref:hypothetical protein n=1 Tax=Tropicimonas sp. IMCC6043 TaxID=2510645 RepID=UPI00101C0A79|nr:hypothetical protein [Tropicimonas sp. IMCC6043]RYH08785.1 hypothetical protein EU800_14990 [Tropicimonas sp. IMCC6043]
MKYRFHLLTAAIVVASSLASVASASTTLDAQRDAIVQCKAQRFVGGAAYIVQRKGASASSQMAVEILPYDQVTYVDADAINRCAAKRLGLTQAEIDKIGWRTRTIVRSIRYPNGYRGQGCGRTPSILYKGDLYCQWARR